MKEAQEIDSRAKAQTFYDRERLEKSIAFACQKIPHITNDMVAVANIVLLGEIIIGLNLLRLLIVPCSYFLLD